MTHPEDLLAEYVDGTLPDRERALVDAHLDGCGRCREEVALAAGAVAALAALPEEPVPLAVTAPVVAEARRAAGRRQPWWQRSEWAVGLAAAAVLALTAGVVLPRVVRDAGDDGGAPATRAAAEASADAGAGLEMTPAPLQLETLDRDLDERDLRRLAREAAKVAPAPPAPEGAVSMSAPDDAISCLVASGATVDERDVLVRVLSASYLGTPAYVGVFHEGPGGGQPPQRVVVWVVSSADCAILTLLSQNV